MKLFLNATSPYARLIQVLLIETRLDAETELVRTDPWNADDALLAANAAAKIPALTLDDGTHLVESACIADYLIHRSGRTVLASREPSRLAILGLGRAAMDCAFGSVIQDRFTAGSPLAARWREALPRIAARLDAIYAPSDGDADLADLTVAVAFEYIDFRLPAVRWRDIAPRLAQHLSPLAARPSLATTRPA